MSWFEKVWKGAELFGLTHFIERLAGLAGLAGPASRPSQPDPARPGRLVQPGQLDFASSDMSWSEA